MKKWFNNYLLGIYHIKDLRTEHAVDIFDLSDSTLSSFICAYYRQETEETKTQIK